MNNSKKLKTPKEQIIYNNMNNSKKLKHLQKRQYIIIWKVIIIQDIKCLGRNMKGGNSFHINITKK